MSKKIKKKTLKWLLAGAVVVAATSAIAVVDLTTGAVTDVLAERNYADGKYAVDLEMIESFETSKESYSLKYDLGDGPFESINYEFKFAKPENGKAGLSINSIYNFLNEVEITLSLAKNVDYYISQLDIEAYCLDEDGETYPLSETHKYLDISVSVGNHVFTEFIGQEKFVFMSNNAYSGDVKINVKNLRISEKEASEFAINNLILNSANELWTSEEA